MPPSPVPSSELAAEEQKEKAVEQTNSAIESDQAEPIAVDEDEEAEEEAGCDADDEADEGEEGEAATTTAAPGSETTATAAGLDFDLPRSILRRIVKARLSEVAAKELGEGKEFGVSKEALEALGEGAKVRRGKRTRREAEFFFSFSFRNLLSFFPTRPSSYSLTNSSQSQVFISFITSTANDLCKGAKRQVRESREFEREIEESWTDAIGSFNSRHLTLSNHQTQPPTPHPHQKKKTISADDVVNALADSGFEELAAPLRQEGEAKRLAAKEAAAEKKRDKAAAAEAAQATEAAAVPAN